MAFYAERITTKIMLKINPNQPYVKAFQYHDTTSLKKHIKES
jgi:hypothetical protein